MPPDAAQPFDAGYPADAAQPADGGSQPVTSCAGGVCHYIRAGAVGAATGADWTNAWTDIPSTLVRGHTYFVASGSYPSHTFSPLAGTEYVHLRKATVGDHGTSVGWSDAYASGQAVFGRWFADMAYLSVDGVTGEGTQGHGIRVVDLNTVENSSTVYWNGGPPIPGQVFQHVEFEGPPAGGSNGARVVWLSGPNLTLRHCYVHGGRVWVASCSPGLLLEHNYFQNAGSTDLAFHAAGITVCGSGATIRYNVFENMKGTANTTYIEPQFNFSGVYVYGNVFRATVPDELTSQGILAITGQDVVTDVRVFNNTIYGLRGGWPGVWAGNVAGSQVEVRNNVWQGCQSAATVYGGPSGGNAVASDNLFNGGAQFVAPTHGDFHLAAPTANGTTLGGAYAVDPDGQTRGADGVWDLGAFEY